jgi:hypothetical protein
MGDHSGGDTYASRQIVMKDGCIVSDYPLVALDAGVS